MKSLNVILTIIVGGGYLAIFWQALQNPEGIVWKIVSFNVLVLALLFIAILLYYHIIGRRCRKLCREAFDTLNFSQYLDYINSIIKKRIGGQRYQAAALMDRAVVLFITGDFDQAFTIMNNLEQHIKTEKNPLIRGLYYNNLLEYFLISQRLEDAKELYKNQKDLFDKVLYRKRVPLTLRKIIAGTLMSYELEFGDAAKAKKYFEEGLNNVTKTNKLRTLEFEYSIALADLKIGDKKEAEKRMRRIWPETKGTFLYDLIAKHISSKQMKKALNYSDAR